MFLINLFCLNLYNFEKQLGHRCFKKGIVEICQGDNLTINTECNPKKQDDRPEYLGVDDGHGGYYWAIHVSNLIFKEINKRYFESKLKPNAKKANTKIIKQIRKKTKKSNYQKDSYE